MASQQQMKATATAPTSGPVYGLAQSDEQKRLQQQAAAAYQAQQGGQAMQQQSFDMLQAQATGQAGPSQAQMLAAQQNQSNMVAQMGQAAQGSGGNLASQGRQAAGIGAASQMAGMQQQAQMQQQEQMAAQQAMTQQANMISQQQQQAFLAQQQQAQGVNQFVQGQGQQGAQFNQGAAAQQVAANRQFGMDVAGQAAGAVQGAAMMSDERVKDISNYDADNAAIKAVQRLRALEYEYKGKGKYGQEGNILGISAQDIEAAAPQLVVETPKGKAVSMPGGVSLALAAVSALARKVEARA